MVWTLIPKKTSMSNIMGRPVKSITKYIFYKLLLLGKKAVR